MKKTDILILRLDAIGDFILWLDSARHFRKIFPGRHITLIGNSIWTDLAKELPYFDDVIEIPQSRYRGRFKFIKSLIWDFFRFKYWSANIVIHPVISRSLHSNLIARWISSPTKIAPSGDKKNLNQKINRIPGFSYESTCRWYSQIIPILNNGTMELMSNAEFMSKLSGITIEPQLPNLRGLLNLNTDKQIPSKPYVVIVPGANDTKRTWGTEKFSQTIQTLPQDISIVICGSHSEKKLTQTLTDMIKSKARDVMNLGGKTTLMELIFIISQAKYVIGNESSAIHIASSLHVPSIAILGGGHFGRFLPYQIGNDVSLPSYAPQIAHHKMVCYGCNWNCSIYQAKMKRWPCIQNIASQSVIGFLPQD